MKRNMLRFVALVLCCTCFVACVGIASADTYTSEINFVEGKATYGPGTSGYYHKKGNDNTNWSVQYTSGWNAVTSVYLYDREYGGRATHIESVQREAAAKTGLSYIGSNCCKSSHNYKIVAKRDISQYSGPYQFVYIWTI